MKNPCKQHCPDRSPSCHAECFEYLCFYYSNLKKKEENLMQSRINDYVQKEIVKSKKGVR